MLKSMIQPPSGGCVLKRTGKREVLRGLPQPPSGGCVLKRHGRPNPRDSARQPPSGGCVLKHIRLNALRAYGSSRLQAAVC